MATLTPNKRNERVRQLAKGYYGQHLIDWLEEIQLTYSDVRNAKKLGLNMDTAVAVASILESELIQPLKDWRHPAPAGPDPSGDQSE